MRRPVAPPGENDLEEALDVLDAAEEPAAVVPFTMTLDELTPEQFDDKAKADFIADLAKGLGVPPEVRKQSSVLYGTVPYRTVPYRTVLYCTALHCTVM